MKIGMDMRPSSTASGTICTPRMTKNPALGPRMNWTMPNTSCAENEAPMAMMNTVHGPALPKRSTTMPTKYPAST